MRTIRLALLLLALCSLTAIAQERPPEPPGAGPAAGPRAPGPAVQRGLYEPPGPFPGLPTVALEPLLERVGRAANKRFLIDSHVNPQIYLGGVEANAVTYPLLLSILRSNNLATVEIEDRVNVIPVNELRFFPAPIANEDDPKIAADEWRTRVLTLQNVEAANLVPILRPLLPQSAHLAAFPPSNQLLIVDRYANLKRITEIVRTMDRPPRK
jgi:general secretion pathway protein D